MSSAAGPRPVPRRRGIDAAAFAHDVQPAHEPVVSEGLVAGWPAVHEGRADDASFARWLAGFDSGREVDAVMVRPGHGGRLEHDVFGPPGAAVDHLPPDRRAMLGTLDATLAGTLRAALRDKLRDDGGGESGGS